jgi:hypothetical protein
MARLRSFTFRWTWSKLKPDVSDHAIETLSKSFIVPILEKLLADGSLIEYEIDTEAIHTEAPGTASITAYWTENDGTHSQTFTYTIVRRNGK